MLDSSGRRAAETAWIESVPAFAGSIGFSKGIMTCLGFGGLPTDFDSCRTLEMCQYSHGALTGSLLYFGFTVSALLYSFELSILVASVSDSLLGRNDDVFLGSYLGY